MWWKTRSSAPTSRIGKRTSIIASSVNGMTGMLPCCRRSRRASRTALMARNLPTISERRNPTRCRTFRARQTTRADPHVENSQQAGKHSPVLVKNSSGDRQRILVASIHLRKLAFFGPHMGYYGEVYSARALEELRLAFDG